VFVEQAATGNRDVLQQLTTEYSVSCRKRMGSYRGQLPCPAVPSQELGKTKLSRTFRNTIKTAKFVMPVGILLS
jgi:hypothetical protein